ncbi:MAG: hypothetical protein N4A63_13125 [Vallitalea sp.]|nr:hypothetical protein [Vallitalea sp.]
MKFYSKHDIWLGVILLGGIGIGMVSTLVSSKISIKLETLYHHQHVLWIV